MPRVPKFAKMAKLDFFSLSEQHIMNDGLHFVDELLEV
jgi:hypothetical protein